MPELPEVETVKEKLKKEIVNTKIKHVIIKHKNIIEYPSVEEFSKLITNQTIININRRGKWLLFELDNYFLLSHLRMEGKYNIKKVGEKLDKHDHVIFELNNNKELRYNDTRKFGKMYLKLKDDIYSTLPLEKLGLEPDDNMLTINYLKEKLKNKTIPIKSSLLDQTIIAGIGNIYADEILFESKIHPEKKSNKLTNDELSRIIKNTNKIFIKAINAGGTTIKSYTSAEGVHGEFQHKLKIYQRSGEKCIICKEEIKKIKVGGRGTYYCAKCQKNKPT